MAGIVETRAVVEKMQLSNLLALQIAPYRRLS
jgi:hypothetical protein